jgi:HAMP domain-containing protein
MSRWPEAILLAVWALIAASLFYAWARCERAINEQDKKDTEE